MLCSRGIGLCGGNRIWDGDHLLQIALVSVVIYLLEKRLKMTLHFEIQVVNLGLHLWPDFLAHSLGLKLDFKTYCMG